MLRKEVPFKAGDRVIVHDHVFDNYGYTNAVPYIEPDDDVIGEEIIITEVDVDGLKPDMYPDCMFYTEGGRESFVDICFLEKLEESLPRSEMPKLTPQCKKLLEHLKSGHSISQRSAMLDFGIASLPRRIADLKAHGFAINTEMKTNPQTEARYASYTLGN